VGTTELKDEGIPPVSAPNHGIASGEEQPGSRRGQRIIRWIRIHRIRTILIVVVLVIIAELATIPFFAIWNLSGENPGQTALMRQRLEEAEESGKPLKIVRQWIAISRLPRHLLDAVIVAEDGTFYRHSGIDWFEVQESFNRNMEEGRFARGASTITQQLAKNLYLSTSKDPVRKIKEVIITLLLEQQLSKQRILELYLNCIEWGRGIFGVEAAARTYFGKSAAMLSLDESTRLAAVIPSPLKHRPDQNTRYVLRRQQIVLRRMEARNFTDSTTSEETTSSLPQTRPSPESIPSPGVDSTKSIDSTDIDEEEEHEL
jgi:monofunctional glycosyltransferase